MRIRIIALGSAFLLFAAGAQARAISSAERAETSALNLEQSERNQAALPQAPLATDYAANLPANAPPAAAPTMVAEAASLPPALTPPPPATNTGVVKTLDKMDGLPNKVASAKVIDENGKQIGTVQLIQFGAANAPLKLDVLLVGGKVVTMDAGRVSYNPADNTVIARSADGALTEAQH